MGPLVIPAGGFREFALERSGQGFGNRFRAVEHDTRFVQDARLDIRRQQARLADAPEIALVDLSDQYPISCRCGFTGTAMKISNGFSGALGTMLRKPAPFSEMGVLCGSGIEIRSE